MLHQNISPPAAAEALLAKRISGSSDLLDLLDDARRHLENDPRRARFYLDRIAEMFGTRDPVSSSEEMLLPAMPGRRDAPAVKGGLASWQLRRVMEHMDRALDAPIVIETLADIAKLSAGHFCRAFKASVGEAPHAFLIRSRIRRAQMMMLRTDETLSQIACACGLTDQAHLTRLFRKMVGETPLAWRRTWRQPS